MNPRSLCVYCGSRDGSDPEHAACATTLGQMIAHEGIELIYGGGSLGLMGRIANATLNAGGEVVGIIPASLQERELAHRGLTKLHVVTSMHERKSLMAQLAGGFIAMPGGLGTLEELFEMLTWQQLGMHAKPVGLLNSSGYFDDLIAFLELSVRHGYVAASDYKKLKIGNTPEALLRQLLDT